METQELKELIESTEASVNSIEKHLKMGSGTLAKALTGKRTLPEKWIEPLKAHIAFLKSNPEFKPEPAKAQPEKYKNPVKKIIEAEKTSFTDKEILDKVPIEIVVVPDEPAPEIAPAEKPQMEETEPEPPIITPEPPVIIPEWVPAVEEFCNKQGIVPQDLIDAYGKKPVKEKKKIPGVDLLGVDRADGEDYVTNPLNRRMSEPEEGTNAFFIRYGAYTKAEVKKNIKRPVVDEGLLPQ